MSDKWAILLLVVGIILLVANYDTARAVLFTDFDEASGVVQTSELRRVEAHSFRFRGTEYVCCDLVYNYSVQNVAYQSDT